MFDFLVSWVSVFNPVISIIILAIIVLFIINICYKFLMDQNEVKRIKEKTKEMNKQWKKMQKDGNADKAKTVMSEMMQENNKMMMMTFKPMLVSMILVIFILPGLSEIYGNVNSEGSSVVLNGQTYELTIQNEKVIVGELECETPCREKIEGAVWNIKKENEGILFERVIAVLPVSLPFFGDDLGWLGWYFICSIPLMLIIKKILKVNV